jgi:hypothetical protein
MDEYLELNDQAAMEASAAEIAVLTDLKNRARTWYMPTSRDLSPGKQALIVEWAAEVARRNQP